MSVTAKEALYNLINRTNEVEYSDANVILSAPAENTDVSASSKNTSVLITGRSSANKTGTVRLYYNRVNIRTVTGTAPVVIEWDDELRVADLIPKLNSLFNIHHPPFLIAFNIRASKNYLFVSDYLNFRFILQKLCLIGPKVIFCSLKSLIIGLENERIR